MLGSWSCEVMPTVVATEGWGLNEFLERDERASE